MFLLIELLGEKWEDLVRVSIHLMFLLIVSPTMSVMLVPSFNTSHVSINLCKLTKQNRGRAGFQYISCFY